eukprot:5169481-Prymnesium_polylepis.1
MPSQRGGATRGRVCHAPNLGAVPSQRPRGSARVRGVRGVPRGSAGQGQTSGAAECGAAIDGASMA